MKKYSLLLLFVFTISFIFVFPAFAEEWSYEIKDECAIITGCDGAGKELIIPAEIDGYQVTGIADECFLSNATIESVTFPDTLLWIGRKSFLDCTALTEVTFGNSLDRIESSAFEGTKISSVEIPDSVTYMGPYAFCNCTALRNLTVGSGVTEWGTDWGENSAFKNCTLLTSLVLRDGLTSIGPGTFMGCTLLLDLTCPASIERIGNNSFEGCELLESAVLSGVVGEKAFLNCKGLKSLSLSNVTAIERSAFENNTMLDGFDLPSTLQSIGGSAFRGCTKLKNIVIPDSTTYFGDHVFAECTQLSSAVIGSGIEEWGYDWGENEAFLGCSKLETLDIKEGIKKLPTSIFKNCSSLQYVLIPGTVSTIEDYAFYNCGMLDTVQFEEGLETINKCAFEMCPKLSVADLPVSLRTIGSYSFRGSALSSVLLPDKVKTIGCYAFSDCPNITSVTIGAGVEEWILDWGCNYAFKNDSKISEVIIKEGALSIGANAFENCVSIPSIEVPITVTDVGNAAFAGCTSLQKASVERGRIGEKAFYECTSLRELQIPRVSSIEKEAFYNDSNLQDFELPETITSIGSSAFYGCSSLKYLTIPDSVSYLGYYAFADCGLKHLVVGNNVTEWGQDWGTNGAFMENTGMTHVAIMDGANSISSSEFAGCSSLVAVSIPESIDYIGEDAFMGCSESLCFYVTGQKAEKLMSDLGYNVTYDEFVMPENTEKSTENLNKDSDDETENNEEDTVISERSNESNDEIHEMGSSDLNGSNNEKLAESNQENSDDDNESLSWLNNETDQDEKPSNSIMFDYTSIIDPENDLVISLTGAEVTKTKNIIYGTVENKGEIDYTNIVLHAVFSDADENEIVFNDVELGDELVLKAGEKTEFEAYVDRNDMIQMCVVTVISAEKT